MEIIFGLVGALGWGGADFLARYSTRMIGTYRTLLYAQFIGFVALGLYLVISGELARVIASAPLEAWLWALLVAVFNIAASMALYRGYEIGVLAVVSPLAASYAAVTVILSLFSGETLDLVHLLGIILAILGVVLAVARFSPPTAPPYHTQEIQLSRSAAKNLPKGTWLALLSAFMFGVSFWLLGFKVAPLLGGVAPVWIFRLSAIVILILLAPPIGQNIRLPQGRVWWFIIGIGALDTTAFVATTIGFMGREIAIISVLSSLFGAVTLVLGRIFLDEPLERTQWIGIVIIFIGVVLVSL